MSALIPESFGKVAVVMGGWSAEREVSLVSGAAVLKALLKNNIDAHGIDMDKNIAQRLKEEKFDRVFNIAHGRGGEDGLLQGVLDFADIPYTGSDVMGSAIAMDKYRSKLIWKALGLATPDFVLLNSKDDLPKAAALGFPLILKAALEGSSIGVAKADNQGQLEAAWVECSACDSHVIAEQWVEGAEYTAAIVGDKVFPLIRLETPHAFYDYAAKYQESDTQYILPCGLNAERELDLQKLCLEAFNAIGVTGWGRVDFMTDKQGKAWLIEVNTVPGMTDHSLVPMAAEATGIDFPELVVQILTQTLELSRG